jgi:preprotein translocase subunit SecD
MKTLLSFCAIWAIAASAHCADNTTSKTNVLRFFVVSESSIPGGRNIDTPELPKLGYIRAQPDMLVLGLQTVATNTTHSISQYAGKTTEADKLAIDVVMLPADAKRFAELTRQNVGSRLLLMLGDRPLIAPVIRIPIEAGHLQFTLGKRKDADRVREDLKSLVSPE